jgi:type IV pilus assembly protein PilA
MLNYFNRKLNNRKGFTLIELIIVVAILGILAGIAAPRFTSVTVDARTNADKANAKVIADATLLGIAQGKYTITAAEQTKTVATLVTDGFLNSEPKPSVETGTNKFFVVIIAASTGNVSVFYGSDATTEIGTALN